MALWKIDEEEGEGIGAGGVKSVYLCMCCLLPLQNADWVNNRHLERDSFAKGFFFLHVAEARPQCLLAASLNKKKTKSYINRYQQQLLC